MGEKQKSRVFMFDNADPEMQRAYERARDTFRYFWREVAWDRRRIIPALGMAAVKAPFSDGKKPGGKPDTEHMWMSEIDFDGEFISGELINAPNKLKSVKQGDSVRVRLAEISDWIYTVSDVAYGAHTVNLMRSRMSKKELKSHDDAWGLDFGDPAKVRLPTEQQQLAFCETLAASLKEHLVEHPEYATESFDGGWTLLHNEALAGNAPAVKVLLAAGADPEARTEAGKTPRQLAKSLGWDHVVALLAPK
jgi:uncharacterized protein YegJ (DUF2314 family)